MHSLVSSVVIFFTAFLWWNSSSCNSNPGTGPVASMATSRPDPDGGSPGKVESAPSQAKGERQQKKKPGETVFVSEKNNVRHELRVKRAPKKKLEFSFHRKNGECSWSISGVARYMGVEMDEGEDYDVIDVDTYEARKPATCKILIATEVDNGPVGAVRIRGDCGNTCGLDKPLEVVSMRRKP